MIVGMLLAFYLENPQPRPTHGNKQPTQRSYLMCSEPEQWGLDRFRTATFSLTFPNLSHAIVLQIAPRPALEHERPLSSRRRIRHPTE
eukprot:1079501-Pyramimonas_sp.AAC.1